MTPPPPNDLSPLAVSPIHHPPTQPGVIIPLLTFPSVCTHTLPSCKPRIEPQWLPSPGALDCECTALQPYLAFKVLAALMPAVPARWSSRRASLSFSASDRATSTCLPARFSGATSVHSHAGYSESSSAIGSAPSFRVCRPVMRVPAAHDDCGRATGEERSVLALE